MAESSQDALVRAYTMLLSLRKNIDKMTAHSVPETYVNEFHTVLDRVEGIGIDVSEFRIPDSEITPRVTTITTLSFSDKPAGPKYSKEKYVERSLILIKLDALLGYFEIITSENPRKIGFTK